MICPPPDYPPVGLCYCGCGFPTTLVTTKNQDTRYGQLPGDYRKFRVGHNHRGVKKSPETRLKMGAWQRGANNSAWKGGISTENQRARHSAEFKAWRLGVFERDDYTCWDCGTKGGVLNAHHLKPWAKYPELRFVLTNGITVCEAPCHKIRTKREGK